MHMDQWVAERGKSNKLKFNDPAANGWWTPIDLNLHFEDFIYFFLINDRITWNDIFIISSNYNAKGPLVTC